MSITTSLSFSRPQKSARIGLTSLIDVVFLLLMFFMLATSFEQWRSFRLTTAGEDGATTQKQPDILLLRVHPGHIDLNDRRIELSQIGDELNSLPTDVQVIVKPMPDTQLQRVVTVIDQLRIDGIRNPIVDID